MDAAAAIRDRLRPLVAGRRVLVLFSGGKDSALCLSLLEGLGAEVEALHFHHRWGLGISTGEARRIAGALGVPLHEVDYTDEVRRRVLGTTEGRPCKSCKIGMYRIALDRAVAGRVDYLCVGDNASDTVVGRVVAHQRQRGLDPAALLSTTHLDCAAEGVALGAGMAVLRPVIELAAAEVERTLAARGIVVARNHETGDKYFEYWREGCPLQYREPGAPVEEADLDRLHAVNAVATAVARQGGFRASVHLPSGRVVTVPAGREAEVAAACRAAGHPIPDPAPAGRDRPPLERLVVEVFGLAPGLLATTAAVLPLVDRFVERTELVVLGRVAHAPPAGVVVVLALAGGHLAVRTFPSRGYLRLEVAVDTPLTSRSSLEHILFEIFKTREWEVG